MAIEIRIESAWDTDDGEGRRVEVSVAERQLPSEDPLEGSRYFASGDVRALKQYLCDLLDRKSSLFVGPRRRECAGCGKVLETAEAEPRFVCGDCSGKAR
jgi:ribosomal protein S27AE